MQQRLGLTSLVVRDTDDLWRDWRDYRARGVVFVRELKVETWGTVAVFRDLYGNLWDLLEPSAQSNKA